MKIHELISETISPAKAALRAEKKAAATAAAKSQFVKKHYGEDDAEFITIPVHIGGKVVKRDFIIDNTHEQRTKLSHIELIDMGQIEADPRQREKNEGDAKYAIYNGQLKRGVGTASLPAYLHGLPARTRHKDPTTPQDLRRVMYE